MSFDKLHINRTNYEEYFLLYLDGELSIEQRMDVENFAALHPDLQQELNILLSTRMESEAIHFDNKEELYAANMKLQVMDESLLFYLDNELTGQEKTKLELRLQSDTLLSNQYRQLQSAKLDNADVILFPDKNKLFRFGKERSIPVIWYRVAAAVVILLTSGLFWLSTNEGEAIPAVTYNQGSKNIDTVVKASPKLVTVDQPTAPVLAKKTESERINKPEISSPAQKKFGTIQRPGISPNIPDKALAKIEKPAPVVDQSQATNKNVSTALQHDINTSTVTSQVSLPYNETEANDISSMVKNTVAFENNGDKKGSVRGFLRKASRFIERRTGINPVNDDKELYIGVVAIKL